MTILLISPALGIETLLQQDAIPQDLEGAIRPGVVVEKVAHQGEGEKAGLQEGDILLAWSRGDSKGEIESPFGLAAIEIEERPRGRVALEGRRGTEKLAWSLGYGPWQIEVRPNFSGQLLSAYREGQELAKTGKPAEAVKAAQRWKEIASQRPDSRVPWLPAWLLLHSAEALQDARQWKQADDGYRSAVQSAYPTSPVIQGQLLQAWAEAYQGRSDWANAEKYFQESIAKISSSGSNELTVAAVLNALGTISAQRGESSKAEHYYRQALEIGQKLAPKSLVIAASLNNLGIVALQQGDLTKAKEYFSRALEIREELVPGSLDVAGSYNNLGLVTWKRGDLTKAEEYYGRALEIGKKLAPGSLSVATTFNNLGNVVLDQGDLAKAEEYYGQALEIREKLAPGSLNVASSFNSLGNVALRRGDLAKAEEYYGRGLEIGKKLAPGSLNVATTFSNLGNVVLDRGDLAKAEEYYGQALEIREKLAPGSLDVAASFNSLGIVAEQRGDLAKGEEYYGRALEIRKKLAPGSLDVAASFNNLGIVAEQRGDLAKGEEYYDRALEIQKKLAPGSLDVAFSFNNLGNIAYKRGNLAKADEYYRQALEIQKKLAPGSLNIANGYNNLGLVAEKREDLAKSEEYYRQALEIEKKLAPGSLAVAYNLNGLGAVAQKQGNLAKAEEYYRQALEISQKLALGSLDVARSLRNLGNVAYGRGNLAKAEEYYRQALEIQEKLAPGSLDVAQSCGDLGNVAFDREDLTKAEEYYLRAQEIGEKVAPRSIDYAETLAALARVARRIQKLEAAAQMYERALTALEGQTAGLGGSEEVRSSFRASYSDIYKDYLDLLLALKQPGLAFEVLERSRSRILLEMLLAAHVDIRKGADPSLLQQERSLQESLSAKSDRRLRLLGDKKDEKQIAAFTQEIEDLERQYQEIEDRLRSTSPAYAALTQPQPLPTSEIQQLLDPDAVLLDYSLGEKRSYLFVVTVSAVNVYELPKRAEIKRAAQTLYGLLSSRSTSIQGEMRSQRQARWRKAEAGYAEAAEKLSQMILAPVAKQIQSKRLLIVGDGALQYIPFAALPSPESRIGSKVPLIAEHEIVNLPSASILSVLRREVSARKEPSKAVMVMADPVFDSHDDRLRGSLKTSEVSANLSEVTDQFSLDRSAREVGAARDGIFPRLPFSRREAEAIYATAKPGDATKILDFDASKATATSSQLGDYRIVHLATHGLVDSEHPEFSGLVFSLIDRQGRNQDGFLRLSDIYNLELNADLVVLSACQTALGKQISGEGLIGITRGFIYAGSPRVIASLWKVDDEATAELMKKFYEGVLKNGERPAEALRAAQLWMLKQPRWKAPYYWAGFILQGEWK